MTYDALCASISELAEEAQALLDALYLQTPEPESASVLAQAGLCDGARIVQELLKHREPGVAFEHVLYMVGEADLRLSRESRQRIGRVGRALHLPESAYATACR